MALPPHISGSKSTALMSGQHCTTGELKYFYLCTNPTPNLLPHYNPQLIRSKAAWVPNLNQSMSCSCVSVQRSMVRQLVLPNGYN